jgi:hypothetical protein
MNDLIHNQISLLESQSFWNEIYLKFPGSEEYIIKCLLDNELRYLEDNEYIFEQWEKDRLRYLRDRKNDNGGSF